MIDVRRLFVAGCTGSMVCWSAWFGGQPLRAASASLPVMHQDTQDAVQEDAQDDAAESVGLPELLAELMGRMERDQKVRFSFLDWQKEHQGQQPNQENGGLELLEGMTAIDAENREWLSGIVEEHGWPGKTAVGQAGAHAAWLLVQHADADRDFQQKCLELMTAAGTEEVAATDLAYLTDRVLVGTGKKQRYGTQLKMVDGRLTVNEVEDAERLDELRAEMGMEPIADYIKRAEAMYLKKDD